MNTENWAQQVQYYCEKYNIPLEYLAEIISEPKVIPMIRGKAFEFSAMLRLQEILPSSEWIVDKPVMNAQFGLHDMDVRITHRATQKIIGVECKLAGKGSFKMLKNKDTQIRVKCMRSRTLGESKANELAAKIGIDPILLKVHNDQYLPTDFQVVITSIANAFYETDEETSFFEWQPSEMGRQFLQQLHDGKEENLQHFAYNQLYLATSKDLAVTTENSIKCTRSACPMPQNCGFIPNYPLITFQNGNILPEKPWVAVQNANNFFLKLIKTIKK
jgi:hypothetical protein